MRDRMERLIVLPFAGGCVSQSSVALGEHHPARKSKPPDTNPHPLIRAREDEKSLSGANVKTSFGFLALPRPNISTGFQRLFKGFKNFSHLFVYEEEIEEVEMEMEIGLPTNVKHVTHIGWDGSATTNPIRGWDSLMPPELFSLPSLPLRQ